MKLVLDLLLHLIPFFQRANAFQNQLSFKEIIKQVTKLLTESCDKLLELHFITGDLSRSTNVERRFRFQSRLWDIREIYTVSFGSI